MPEIQNIVIVGASFAGQGLANTLVPNLPLTHRILLVDALDFGFWPVGSLRASVVSGWEKKVVAPLSTATVFPAGSAHQVIAPNKVVQLKERSIVLEHPFEGSTEIPFFKCILATGSLQPSPMRPAPGSTKEQYMQTLTKTQKEFSKATKIVIVGAGAVGVELAGEIRAIYPKVSITVVHSEKHVLHPQAPTPDYSKTGPSSYSSPPTVLKLSTAIESKFKELNIQAVLGDKVVIPSDSGRQVGSGEWDGSFGLQSGIKTVKLESGKTIEADFVFLSMGNKPNTSLVEKVDRGALDGNLIAVDEYLRVRSSTPSSVLKTNYYAIGDCAATPGWKTALSAQSDYETASVNIINEVKKKPLKKLVRGGTAVMIIPLGPNLGTGQITMPYLGTMLAPTFMVKSIKGKNLFIDDLFLKRFKGSQKVTVAA